MSCTPSACIFRPDQIEPASEAAARAFAADPGMTYILKDARRRERLLPELMRGVVRCGHAFGESYTTEDAAGIAVWFAPPGRGAVTFRRMARAGLVRTGLRLWPAEVWRLMVTSVCTGLLDLEGSLKPHWYLWLLAVDPERQGEGIGSALLRPALERSDREGLPCALETMTEENVAFYRKRGFEVVRGRRCPSGGPHVWAMWREPGRTRGAER